MQPSLKKRPAAIPTSDLLKRLEQADAVTMQPLQQAIDAAQEQGASLPQPVKTKPAQTPAEHYPWDNIDADAVQPFSARINSRLYHQLRYLGDTTYGTNMTGILHRALQTEIDKMLKARGIPIK